MLSLLLLCTWTPCVPVSLDALPFSVLRCFLNGLVGEPWYCVVACYSVASIINKCLSETLMHFRLYAERSNFRVAVRTTNPSIDKLQARRR